MRSMFIDFNIKCLSFCLQVYSVLLMARVWMKIEVFCLQVYSVLLMARVWMKIEVSAFLQTLIIHANGSWLVE